MGIYGEIEIETMQLGHDQWHATRAEYLKRMTPAAGGARRGHLGVCRWGLVTGTFYEFMGSPIVPRCPLVRRDLRAAL